MRREPMTESTEPRDDFVVDEVGTVLIAQATHGLEVSLGGWMNAAGTLKPTTREWFATARNYALYANQGGAYDDILKFIDR